jgi:voltage-gated potassium channel
MTNQQDNETANVGTINLLVLFVSLVIMLMVVPLFEQFLTDRLLLQIALTVLLLVAVATNRRPRGLFIITALLAALAIPVAWTSFFVEYESLFVASCVLEGLFFLLIAVWLLIYVARQPEVSMQSIFGAISAYLLIGLAWAMLYWAIDRSSFENLAYAERLTVSQDKWGNEEVVKFSQLVYFSFVTMSTLGYGDILPRTPIAQTLAWAQSVTGQFYIAILIARLVSALPRRRLDPEDGKS